MDRLVVVSPYKIEKSGCVSCSTTVCGNGVEIDATVAMLDAAAAPVFGLSTRSSEALTSADVSVLPSSNLTPERKVNVTLLLSLLNVQLVARSGTTCRLELRVTSGWYTRPRACRSRKLVAICGSSFCTLEVLAITKAWWGRRRPSACCCHSSCRQPGRYSAQPVLRRERPAAAVKRGACSLPVAAALGGASWAGPIGPGDPGQAHGARARRVECKDVTSSIFRVSTSNIASGRNRSVTQIKRPFLPNGRGYPRLRPRRPASRGLAGPRLT